MTLLAPERSIVTPDDLDQLGVRIYDVPEAAAIDYDRTLGHPPAAMDRLYNVAEAHGVDPSILKEEVRLTEQDGGTYEPLASLSHQLTLCGSNMSLDKLAETYAAHPTPSLLYPDSPDFVRRLDASPQDEPYPHFIATTGPSEVWQKAFKLAGAGCRLHAVFLHNDSKAAYHRGLKSPDGTYDYEMLDSNGVLTGIVRARTLVAVDDKPRCLRGGSGYLVRRAQPLPSQAGDWPQDSTVNGLDELTIRDGRMVRQPAQGTMHKEPTVLPPPSRIYRPIRYRAV